MRFCFMITLILVSMFARANDNLTPPNVVVNPSPTDDVNGQAIYEQHCVVCHQDGIAGAPKFRNEADWKPRLAQKNLDELTASAIKGLNAMPAKGTCPECIDAEIRAAVDYMVPKHE